MNWWEWLITGVFGGAGGLTATVAGIAMYGIRNAEKYVPMVMRKLHETSLKKRQNANSPSR